MRIAAIDIGSNSIRCEVVERRDDGRLRVVAESRVQTRLGYTTADGQLRAEAMNASVEALARMADAAAHAGASRVEAVATAAVRVAPNGAEFVRRACDEAGVDVRTIDAAEEGRLAVVSAARHFDLAGDAVVFDLGGGSMEVVGVEHGEPRWTEAVPLGAVRLTAAFVTADPLPPADAGRLAQHVEGALASLHARSAGGTVIGSGGTVNAIGAVYAASRGKKPSWSHRRFVPASEVSALLARLLASTAAERAAIPGLPAHRTDIITAGVLVVDALLRRLGADALGINRRGLREGLALDILGRHEGQ